MVCNAFRWHEIVIVFQNHRCSALWCHFQHVFLSGFGGEWITGRCVYLRQQPIIGLNSRGVLPNPFWMITSYVEVISGARLSNNLQCTTSSHLISRLFSQHLREFDSSQSHVTLTINLLDQPPTACFHTHLDTGSMACQHQDATQEDKDNLTAT